MVAFMAKFRAKYGNDIQLERVWRKAGGTDMVLNGTIHMTEPPGSKKQPRRTTLSAGTRTKEHRQSYSNQLPAEAILHL
ncbi:unnamed protein product [Polarella glacialis]|uniref:Uncharacterized protein n=1 Tax=Polarella glacialis TaxID=89957 RepID=A0A813F4N2_POLGL|nr:unnamed protein product [Polarella glacialis]